MDPLAISIITALIRTGVAAAGGYMVQKGLGDGSIAQQVAGYAGVAAAAIWSWLNKVIFHRQIEQAAETGKVPVSGHA